MQRLGTGSIVLATLVLVGCGTGVPSTQPPGSTPTAATPVIQTPRPARTPGEVVASQAAWQYEEVEFSAEGGPMLRGRVWSEGRVGAVLAHGFSPDSGQDDWNPFAQHLADLGYGVLTFDFRGFCDRLGCSGDRAERDLAANWRDVVAAIEYLRSRGTERIFLVGASMGGINAFRAADEAELDLAGIVSLATPQFPSRYYPTLEKRANDVTPDRLRRIAAPKLFIAGADDWQHSAQEGLLDPSVGSLSFAADARSMFEASPEPRQLEIVESRVHSSGLVTTATPEIIEQTRELIVTFIATHA